MKNNYLTKCLCITLISSMVLAGPLPAFGAEGTDAFVSESTFTDQVNEDQSFSQESGGDFSSGPEDGTDPVQGGDTAPAPGAEASPTPGEEITPTPGAEPMPTPGGEVTPTPGGEITPTPGAEPTPTPGGGVTPTPGGEVTPTPGGEVTPTPGGEVTPTPGGEITPTPGTDLTPTPELSPVPVPTEILMPEKVKDLIDKINSLALTEITIKHEAKIVKLRELYEALTDEEKTMVSNYQLLVGYETKIMEIKASFDDKDPAAFTDDTVQNVKIGEPVYFTNMVSNIHAGKEFYLDTLKKEYSLTFSDDFSSVMDSIEKEYKKKNKLSDPSDEREDGVTTSEDMFLVRNWQDIIAVYIYEQSRDGRKSFILDSSCKEDLAVIFEEMNPVVRDKQNITHASYGNRHINYYIKKNKIAKEDREILKKYVETDCKLLCATVTASKGFVRQSVGDEVSEERVNVIAAAYSLVGKVGYFWGGKSTVFGDDPSWGTAERVTAAGSNSTGTVRAYGLDCSGFVTWAVVNGYHDKSMQAAVGDGTSDQWMKAGVVSEQNAQPGDLVFQRGPEAGSDNHVGILCGKTDAGDWIAVHCSSGKNGVTVGEAYGASFRYIRKPSFYPGDDERNALELPGFISDGADSVAGNTLQDMIKQNQFTSREKKEDSLMDIISSNSDDMEVFIGG